MCFGGGGGGGGGGHGEPRVAVRRILSCMFIWCEFAVWWLCVYCVSLRAFCVCCWGAWPAIWSQWGAFSMGCFHAVCILYAWCAHLLISSNVQLSIPII